MFKRAVQAKAPKSAVQNFAAPTGGWVQNTNLRAPSRDQAEKLDNILPTSRGGKLRHGSARFTQIGARTTALMPYSSGGSRVLVAATGSSLHVISNPEVLSSAGGPLPHLDSKFFSDGTGYLDGPVPASVSGLLGGDWSYTQFANSAGEFLYMTNVSDGPYYYDGSSLTAAAVTGATGLSAVWSFGKRLFFVEQGTLSAWYLATNAIAGALTEFPLQGVFRRGGSLLFGSAWSVDSGEGLDDLCVFVTDRGEVAVYSGSDPASDFALQGVYEIGTPLDKNTWFRSGGDLAILTEEGIIPLSAALRLDRAALTQESVSLPIEDAWLDAVRRRADLYPFGVTFWRREEQLVVSGIRDAGTPVCYVANAQTGRWCRYTGWDVQAGCVLDGDFYFGDENGYIYKAGIGGTDSGTPITATYVARFDDLGSADIKEAVHARLVARSNTGINPKLFANSDYIVTLPSSVDDTDGTSGAAWGTALWGAFVWGGAAPTLAVQQWQSVNAIGSSLSVGFQIKSTNTEAWDFEVAGIDLVYQRGRLL